MPSRNPNQENFTSVKPGHQQVDPKKTGDGEAVPSGKTDRCC